MKWAWWRGLRPQRCSHEIRSCDIVAFCGHETNPRFHVTCPCVKCGKLLAASYGRVLDAKLVA